MTTTQTVYQDRTDQPPSAIPVLGGESVQSWQPDHPYLEPVCVPPLCQLIMEGRSLQDLAPFVRGPGEWSISGEIKV